MIDKGNSQKAKMEKILVVTDGFQPSIMGIEQAVQMAKEKDADLIALYVDTSFSDVDTRGYDAFAGVRQWVHTRIAQVRICSKAWAMGQTTRVQHSFRGAKLRKAPSAM